MAEAPPIWKRSRWRRGAAVEVQVREGLAALEGNGDAHLVDDAMARQEGAPGGRRVLPARVVGVGEVGLLRLRAHGEGDEVHRAAADAVPLLAHGREVVADADRGHEAARVPGVDGAMVGTEQIEQPLQQRLL